MITNEKTISMETKKLLNLTSHAIVYRSTDGDFILPASFSPTRVREQSIGSTVYKTVDAKGKEVHIAVDVVDTEVIDLPEQRDGVVLIVSAPVAMLAGRPDVIAPDTYRAAVRDESGRIVAVTRFRTFHKK